MESTVDREVRCNLIDLRCYVYILYKLRFVNIIDIVAIDGVISITALLG